MASAMTSATTSAVTSATRTCPEPPSTGGYVAAICLLLVLLVLVSALALLLWKEKLHIVTQFFTCLGSSSDASRKRSEPQDAEVQPHVSPTKSTSVLSRFGSRNEAAAAAPSQIPASPKQAQGGPEAGDDEYVYIPDQRVAEDDGIDDDDYDDVCFDDADGNGRDAADGNGRDAADGGDDDEDDQSHSFTGELYVTKAAQ